MSIAAKTGLRNKLRELAQHPDGVHSSHPELAQWDTSKIGTQARRLVQMGQLFSVKVAHKDVRYLATAAGRDAFVLAQESRALCAGRKALLMPVTGRAPWPADAEPVVTERTVYTVCPSHAPRFQEHVIPFVHGGLRCA